MYLQITAYAISGCVLGYFFIFRSKLRTHSLKGTSNWIVYIFTALALLAAIYCRIFSINSVAYGHYLFEELSGSLIYPYKILTDQPTLTGATNIVYFLVTTVWQFLFGPTLVAARCLSGVVGILSLIFVYLSVRRLVDTKSALLSVAMASMSQYGTFFARVAYETGWALFFFSFTLYLFSLLNEEHKTGFLTLTLGLTTCLGIFTYPGYTLWLVSIVPFVLWRVAKDRWLSKTQLGLFFLGFLIFFIPAITFHFIYQGHAPLFKGGGTTIATYQSYWPSLLLQLRDVFWIADSLYLNQTSGFIEAAFIGFTFLGIWRLVIVEQKKWANILLYSMLMIPFLSGAVINFPGMRRGIVFIYIFYIFSGTGLVTFLALIPQLEQKMIRKIGYGLCFATLCISTVSVMHGTELSNRLTPFSSISEVLENDHLDDWLKKFRVTVILDLRGPHGDYTADFLKAYKFLSQTHTGRRVNLSVLMPTSGTYFVDFDLHEKNLLLFESEATYSVFAAQYCMANKNQLTTINKPPIISELVPCTPLFSTY